MLQVPKEYTNSIKKSIDTALMSPETNPIAAFDADGTCWFSDVGRDFFRHQVQRGFFPEKQYTWDDYKAVENEDVEEGLVWMAKILAGFKLESVREFGKSAVQEYRPSFIDHQVEIIKHLLDRKIDVYIVTASVKWTIEAAAEEIGISPSNILGIETEVVDGVITDKACHPLTWTIGKATALLERTKGKQPFFVSGNSISDRHLLETSTHIKKIIHSAQTDDSLYPSEKKLLDLAKEKRWHYADFNNAEFK